MTKTLVVVKLQFEGLHNWPSCPFPEVAFLKDKHRHMFHVVAKSSVRHDDRDIEIIMLKRKITKYLADKYPSVSRAENDFFFAADLGPTSCETLAKDLLEMFNLDYCSVLEDNENGAEIYRENSRG